MIHTVRNDVQTIICPFYDTEDKFNLIVAIISLVMDCIYTIYSLLDGKFVWFYFYFFLLAFVLFLSLHIYTKHQTRKPQIILKNGILNYRDELYINFSTISSIKVVDYTCVVTYSQNSIDTPMDLLLYYGDDMEIPKLIQKLLQDYAIDNHYSNIVFE